MAHHDNVPASPSPSLGDLVLATVAGTSHGLSHNHLFLIERLVQMGQLRVREAEGGPSLGQKLVALHRPRELNQGFYRADMAEHLVRIDPHAFHAREERGWWIWEHLIQWHQIEDAGRYGMKGQQFDEWLATVLQRLPNEALEDEAAARAWVLAAEWDLPNSIKALAARRPALWLTEKRQGILAVRETGSWMWEFLTQGLGLDPWTTQVKGQPLWRAMLPRDIGPMDAQGTLRGTVERWVAKNVEEGHHDPLASAYVRKQRRAGLTALLQDRTSKAAQILPLLTREEWLDGSPPQWWRPLRVNKEDWVAQLSKLPWKDQLGTSWPAIAWLDKYRHQSSPSVPEDILANTPSWVWKGLVEHARPWLDKCVLHVREVVVAQALLREQVPKAEPAPARKLRL